MSLENLQLYGKYVKYFTSIDFFFDPWVISF